MKKDSEHWDDENSLNDSDKKFLSYLYEKNNGLKIENLKTFVAHYVDIITSR